MIQKFFRFAAVSGTGWLIDVILTVTLVRVGTSPFLASLIGSVVAVTFVYVVSLRSVFGIKGRLGARAFPLYVIWQAFSISGASALVAVLAYLIAPWIVSVAQTASWMNVSDPLSVASGVAKGLVTPVTLAANFLFFQWLTKGIVTQQSVVPK